MAIVPMSPEEFLDGLQAHALQIDAFGRKVRGLAQAAQRRGERYFSVPLDDAPEKVWRPVQEAWMQVPEGATKRWEIKHTRFALEFTIVEIQQ